MKILLTGITGFIGHHLAIKLLNEGHKVFAIVRPSSKINELSKNLQSNIEIFTYCNDNTVFDIITDMCVKGNRPDVVYHLATFQPNKHRFEDIKNLIQSNITFGTEILDAMVLNNVYNFVNTGTFFQHYENADYSPMNLYAATKTCFEKIIQFYTEVKGLRCISLHLFNTYGENDKRGKFLELLQKVSISGKTLKMSPGEQFIDIVYIDDVIDAFILAGKYLNARKYDICGTYGISSGNPIKLRKIIEIFEKISNKRLSIEWGGLPYREREIMVPWTSYKILPGWEPKVNLEDGIKKFLKLR